MHKVLRAQPTAPRVAMIPPTRVMIAMAWTFPGLALGSYTG